MIEDIHLGACLCVSYVGYGAAEEACWYSCLLAMAWQRGLTSVEDISIQAVAVVVKERRVVRFHLEASTTLLLPSLDVNEYMGERKPEYYIAGRWTIISQQRAYRVRLNNEGPRARQIGDAGCVIGVCILNPMQARVRYPIKTSLISCILRSAPHPEHANLGYLFSQTRPARQHRATPTANLQGWDGDSVLATVGFELLATHAYTLTQPVQAQTAEAWYKATHQLRCNGVRPAHP